MAKNNTKNKKEPAPDVVVEADDEADDDDDEDELELLQVDLGDMIKMKQVLDEAVAAAVLELLPEDYRWDNVKLSVMFAACLFACMAQFAPLPFPESRPILGICGTAYFMLSGVLQLITTFVDKDSILLCQATDTMPAVRVRSNMLRFSDTYTVALEFQTDASKICTQDFNVGKFFDKDGYFDETGLMLATEKLYERFAKKQYDALVVAVAADNGKKSQ